MIEASMYATSLVLRRIFASFPKDKLLVDAGCGSGFHLLSIPAERRIGLDLEPPLITEIQGIKGDATAIPLKNGIVDYLICLDTIEHIKADNKVMEELTRILSDSGTLVLTTPTKSEFMPNRLLRKAFRLDTVELHKQWGHVKAGYTKDELVSLLERNNLIVAYYTTVFQPLTRLLELLTLHTFLSTFLVPKLKRRLSSPDNKANLTNKMRRNRFMRGLERLHDILFLFILPPIIKQLEARGDKGFEHFIVCVKNEAFYEKSFTCLSTL